MNDKLAPTKLLERVPFRSTQTIGVMAGYSPQDGEIDSIGTGLALMAAVMLGLCAPAHAADLGVPYVKAPPPQYDWTGFYVGANVGGASGIETGTSSVGTFSDNPSGVIGGAQLGYNLVVAPNWLLGIEGEFDWTSAQDNVVLPNAVAAATIASNHHWYGTLDGRIGVTQGPGLYYVKGGAAWMDASYLVTNGVTSGPSVDTTRLGWTIGAGVEYMIWSGWSAKFEYDFLDFASQSFAVGTPIVGVSDQVHEVKLGVNYHWSP